MADSTPSVAIITGGASGMGLAVTEHLVSQNWNVAIMDLNEETGHEVAKRLGPQVLFLKADVTSYEEQGEVFRRTWERWGRLNFVYANAVSTPLRAIVQGENNSLALCSRLDRARGLTNRLKQGIGDRMQFCAPVASSSPPDGPPPKPDTLVLDICLYGAVWTAYLALHYFRKNSSGAGKLVFTSSMAGIYPAGPVSLYGAAKHGIVGLTRSIAARLQGQHEPITVNCVCPGLVPTPLVSSALVAACPKDMLTPTETILRAVEGFLKDDVVTGQAAECSGVEIHYRPVLPFSNEAAEYIVTGKYVELGIDGEEIVRESEEKGKKFERMRSNKSKS